MLSSVPALKAHGPQTITATAIPTGASLPHTASLTAGNCQGAEPTFNPALCPAADNRPAASRGGPPSRRHTHHATLSTTIPKSLAVPCFARNTVDALKTIRMLRSRNIDIYIIRLNSEMSASGVSLARISAYLEDMEIPSPRGKKTCQVSPHNFYEPQC